MCSIDTMQPIRVLLFFLLAESLKDSKSSLSQSTLGLALERGFGSQTTLSGNEYRPAMEELEEAITLSNMATPKVGKRLHIPVVRIHDAQVRTSAQLTMVEDKWLLCPWKQSCQHEVKILSFVVIHLHHHHHHQVAWKHLLSFPHLCLSQSKTFFSLFASFLGFSGCVFQVPVHHKFENWRAVYNGTEEKQR